MKMKTKTFILSFLMMFCSVVFGQDWGTTPNKYSSNMTIVTQIMIDNEIQGNNIEIGAFCGDEFRGSARPSDSQYGLVYLTIVGEQNDKISFKLYDHTNNTVLNSICENTVNYIEDAHIGSVAYLDKETGLLADQYITHFTSAVAKIGTKYYKTFDAAYTAAKTGDVIELLRTAVITKSKAWINYSKKNITVKAEFGEAAFRVQDGAYVWFGGMTIESNDYCIIVGASDGSSGASVEIYGGTYKGATTAVSVTKGEVKIMDGTFQVEPYQGSYEYTINCVDANYKNGTAKVSIQKGKFYNFDPMNNAAEGAGTNFVIANCITVKGEDDYWTVVALPTAEKIVSSTDYEVSPFGYESATITVDGEVPCIANGLGIVSNWIGFRITMPEGVDANVARVFTPGSNGTYNEKTLASILDAGKNYASMWVSIQYKREFDYKIDWNNDGKTDLVIYIKANDATIKHNHVEISRVEPTYGVDGSVTYKCGCGDEYTETLPAAIVAKIGETGYTTLSAAVSAATAGETITLIADITDDVTVKKNLTIDGANNNYTGNISVTGKNIKVTVKNVNFINGTGYAITTNTIGSITVENCTVKNYNYGFLYANKSTSTIVVKNVTVDGANYGMHWVYGSNATLENVTMTNVAKGLYIQNYASKTITVKNSNISSIAIWERSGYSGVQTFKFEGDNTVGTLSASQYAKYVLTATDATITAPAGAAVTTTVAEHTVKHINGVYTVVPSVAKVVDAEGKDVDSFGSIQDAIDAAQNGETVVVLKDVVIDELATETLDGKYDTYFKVEGKTVTIDLNGKTISGNYKSNTSMLVGLFSTENNGHLTLEDNSTEKTGTVNICAKNEKVYALIANYEPGCTITINRGTYKLDKAIDSHMYTGGDEGIVVNGGYFHLGNVGDGTNGKPWIFNALEANTNNVIVNGGTFNADVNHQFWANEVYIPETLALQNNGNGTWTVVEAEAYVVEKATSSNATERKVGYVTLTEAFAVAMDKNYTTVGLSKDITTDKVYTIKAGETITFNLNGKTLQGTDNTTKNFGLIQNNGTLTVNAPNGGMMTVVATVNSGWGRYSAVIFNNPGATLTVNGGTIEHLGGTDMAYGIDALTNGNIGNVNTTINGGTIKSTYRAVRQFLNSDSKENNLTVNGGTLEGDNKSIFFHDPSAKANNGTVTVSANAVLKGDVYLYVTAGSTEWPVEVSIANAAFDEESTVVTGNVPETYTVDQVDAIWTVLRINTQELASGWNWFSHYVEGDVLGQLKNGLGENGIMIKTRNAFSEYDVTDGWNGTLYSTNPAQSYKINVSNNQKISIKGNIVDYTTCYITLDNRGWNYIGYPLTQETSVTTAFSAVEMAEDGDLVKTRNGFAEYIDGKWWGSLETMKPGVGYMYFRSNTNTTVDFTYTTSKESVKANITAENNYWVPSVAQYANNMTMVAMLDVKGANYEVAAFVNGEVRGSARPIYVESLDAYMFFLTILGDDVEEVTFKCYDIDTDTEYALSNVINYSNDARVGTIRDPYLLSRGTLGLEELSNNFNIYPNPTTTDREINLTTTCDKVEVFNALGVKVAEYQNVDTIDALEAAGIYVIRVTNNGNVKHCRLVVK
ncbi:MAG: T9SS type A sorting domain-containing protein [Bacteroidales bacterium]|nr:T9SS type A sorting domain-containing protein [Bacteroidales bacterium]